MIVEGVGLVDRLEADRPVEWVPEADRRPNARFVISGLVAGVPRAESAEF